ncbi:MAG TPA: twin-arginine translocase subunit TatC [Acidobacteria bacterium]|nr:twin-arginine translocase subunit TatC [Acidobacteriota bacterium]
MSTDKEGRDSAVLPEPEPPPEAPADQDAPAARMSFLEHLDELRRRVFFAALGVLVGVLACWAFADQLLQILLSPIQQAFDTLSVIRPAEAFMNKVKAAFVGGIFVSLPWVFYQAWAFIAPGLYRRERRWVVPVMLVGTMLFSAGAVFCYIVALPAAVGFLASQGEQFESHITVDYAFGFATKLLLGLGAVFEMPLVVFALARLDLVTARFLLRKIDVAIFLCFLAAAILTPTPDMITMTIFALPMLVLYLISIVVAWLARPRTGG